MTSTFQDRAGSISGNVAIKAPCAVSTTANITLSGEQTLDGVLTASSRVLVKNQTDTTLNGIWDSSSGSWTRSLDFDGSRDAVKGCMVVVNAGTVGAGKVYRLSATDPVVFGTTTITWTEWTVATTPTGVLLQLGSNVASATTTDIGAADSDYVTITGTTTITSLGSTTTKNHIWVKFSGALTLTYNGTSLILPTAANITTVAGDTAEFIRISGSNWQCVRYTRADGTPIHNQFLRTETTIASATTTTLTTAANIWLISGVTTITGFGSSASATYPLYFVRFSGILTLTHNGTSLILPGSANITTANGDTAVLQYLGSGNWKCRSYHKVNGKSVTAIVNTDLPVGCVIDRAYSTYAANANLATALPIDDTIPQSAEGTSILTASITPKSANNRIRATFTGNFAAAAAVYAAALFVDSSTDASAASITNTGSINLASPITLIYEFIPGDTSSHTISIRAGNAGGTGRANGTTAARFLGGVCICTLVLEEIVA